MTPPTQPTTICELRAIADDPDIPEQRRAAAEEALTRLAECERRDRTLAAAEGVAQAWEDVMLRVDTKDEFAHRWMAGDMEPAQRRKLLIDALDELSIQMQAAADAAEKDQAEPVDT